MENSSEDVNLKLNLSDRKPDDAVVRSDCTQRAEWSDQWEGTAVI